MTFVTVGFFLDKGFTFQPHVCNGHHELLMMSMKLRNIAILNINGADYHCFINGISKNKVINVIQNASLTEKSGTLKNRIFLYRE